MERKLIHLTGSGQTMTIDIINRKAVLKHDKSSADIGFWKFIIVLLCFSSFTILCVRIDSRFIIHVIKYLSYVLIKMVKKNEMSIVT